MSATPELSKLTKIPAKAGTVTFTASSIDGSNKKGTYKYTYSSDQSKYSDAALYRTGFDTANTATLIPAYKVIDIKDRKGNKTGEKYEYTIEGSSSNVIDVWFTEKTAIGVPLDTENPDEHIVTVSGGKEIQINKASDSSESIADFGYAEGSISVTNAKVILNENNQHLRFYITKNPAVLTVSKKEGTKTVKKTYSLISESLRDLSTAPAGSFEKVVDPGNAEDPADDRTFTKLYADYNYSGDSLYVLLDDVVNGVEKTVIDEYQTSKELLDIIDVASFNAADNYTTKDTVIRNKTKTVGEIDIPFKNGSNVKLPKTGSYKLAIEYYDSTGKSLRKNSTVVTLKVEKFNKSFTIANTYKMSVNDLAVLPITVKKSTGVSKVEYTGLMNSNEKGAYSKFTTYFELSDASGNSEAANKNSLKPKATPPVGNINGYLLYKVTYENGTVETFSTKITVTITNTVKK